MFFFFGSCGSVQKIHKFKQTRARGCRSTSASFVAPTMALQILEKVALTCDVGVAILATGAYRNRVVFVHKNRAML